MDKIRIKVVKLGNQRYDYLFSKLTTYKSKVFCVDIYEKSLPDCDYEWGYSFNTLTKLLSEDFNPKQYDMVIGFVDTIIELNYFGKRLQDNNVYVISFYQVAELLKDDNNEPFNFMLSTIYRYITRFKLCGEYLTHDETKGCLFDMCGNKYDIVFSCNKPIICESCMSKMRRKGIETDYINFLQKEIKRIHKPNYYRITDFIKKHPVLSLIIGFISSVFINILSTGIYEYIKIVCHK